MNHGTKVACIIAVILLLSGCGIFVAIMARLNWDFHLLPGMQLETKTHSITEPFRNISIDTDTADLVFIPSEDDTAEVVSIEQVGITHSVSVQDGTLRISVEDSRQWYARLFSSGKQRITISLPQQEYASLTIEESTGDITIPEGFLFSDIHISLSTGDTTVGASASGEIKIHSSTGRIHLENLSAGSIHLTLSTGHVSAANVNTEGSIYIKVTTGDVALSQVHCKNLQSMGNTGDVNLENVLATDSFQLERSTGDILFKQCDASQIVIKTDTGDITGSFLTDKIFFATTDTGKVDVPQCTSGGKCEITTDTGDIKITIQ